MNKLKNSKTKIVVCLCLVLVTMIYLFPSDIFADEVGVNHQGDASTLVNSISGMLWLDSNEDGIIDTDETRIDNFPIHLYAADNMVEPVANAVTNQDGLYTFTDLQSGEFVVGINASDTQYLLPLVAFNNNNKFSIDIENSTKAYTNVITIESETIIENIDGGLRTIPEAQEHDSLDPSEFKKPRQENIHIINSAVEMQEFAKKVNMGEIEYVTANVVLGKNIDLSENLNWVGIGTEKNPFKGSFDGKGCYITGLKISSASWYRGLFSRVSGAVIKNVNLELGGNLTVGPSSGALIGNAGSKTRVINCHVEGGGYTISSKDLAKDRCAGGLVGETNDELSFNANDTVYFENCSVTNTTIRAYRGTGGFAGKLNNTNLNGCYTEETTIKAGSWIGGFVGIIYNNSMLTNCYAISPNVTGSDEQGISGGFSGGLDKGSSVIGCYVLDPQVKSTGYAAGFSSLIKTGKAINCYSAGGKAISTSVYCAGGFVGVADENAIITNCYAQTDVENLDKTNGVTGGFVGLIGNTTTSESVTITNCYATGAVKGINKVGGFAGWTKETKGRITKCYATGTVIASGMLVGGFIGDRNNSTNISNCFYDTTTTRMSKAYGDGTETASVKGISTTNAIDYNYLAAQFSSWSINKERLTAAENNKDSAPWYIDDDVTYPYFYYQYDGYTQKETNYNLSYVKYEDGSGLDQKYSDFKINYTGKPVSFKVKSLGAQKVYFPYAGTSRYDINQSDEINVPVTNINYNRFYSLGSVSRTNIIAFDGMPYAVKTSNRPDSEDKSKNTWVGDEITYTIKVSNCSTQAAWSGVVLEDTLPKGITLVDGTLKLLFSNIIENDDNYSPIDIYMAPSEIKPYYTSEYNSDNLQQIMIYLPDFKKSTSDTMDKYKIEFNVLVGRAAATNFMAKDWQFFKNIRNTGTVTGTLSYPNAKNVIKVSFDDENTNPVYNPTVFVKTDEDMNEILNGVKFKLYNGTKTTNGGNDYKNNYTYDENGTEYITNTDGIMYLKLTDGVYKLKEEGAYSAYYEETRGVWYITVENGVITDISTVTAGSEDISTQDIVNVASTDSTGILGEVDYNYYVVKNVKKVGSITLMKQNEAEKKLPGTEFMLEMWVADASNPSGHYVAVTSITTDDMGMLVFKNLKQAKYRITEVSLPSENYAMLMEAIEVSIPDSVTYEEENPTALNESDFYEKNEETGAHTYYYFNPEFTITNTIIIELPETGGGSGNLAVYYAGGLMILAAAAGLYKRRGKC